MKSIFLDDTELTLEAESMGDKMVLSNLTEIFTKNGIKYFWAGRDNDNVNSLSFYPRKLSRS